ncbi:MAG: hypothetical protein ABWZ40_14240 [Caulobacterales bacterium]
MRIRTFTAASMSEAMAMVRREMGTDAIIVSTRNNPRGNVEVRAAIEDSSGQSKVEEAARARRHNDAARYETFDFLHQLTWHGAPDWFARGVAQAAEALDDLEPAPALAAALDSRLGFSPLPIASETAILLAGASGVGKSAALAKLAARAATADAPVAIICAEGANRASVAASAAFAELAGAEFASAADLQQLSGLSARARAAGRVIFIDMPGVNPFDPQDALFARRCASAAWAEMVAVLPADLHPQELEDSAHVFSSLGAKRAIITRLDLARRRAGAVAAAAIGGLKLAHLSMGWQISGGLAPATASRIARMILDVAVEDSRAGNAAKSASAA